MTCRVAIHDTRNSANVVSERFCAPAYLNSFASCDRGCGSKWTHGEEDVGKVHGAQDRVADAGEIEHVAERDEEGRNDVMGEHLSIVFPSRFEVEDDDLLYPDCHRGLSALSPRVQLAQLKGSYMQFERGLESEGHLISVGLHGRLGNDRLTVPLCQRG